MRAILTPAPDSPQISLSGLASPHSYGRGCEPDSESRMTCALVSDCRLASDHRLAVLMTLAAALTNPPIRSPWRCCRVEDFRGLPGQSALSPGTSFWAHRSRCLHSVLVHEFWPYTARSSFLSQTPGAGLTTQFERIKRKSGKETMELAKAPDSWLASLRAPAIRLVVSSVSAPAAVFNCRSTCWLLVCSRRRAITVASVAQGLCNTSGRCQLHVYSTPSDVGSKIPHQRAVITQSMCRTVCDGRAERLRGLPANPQSTSMPKRSMGSTGSPQSALSLCTWACDVISLYYPLCATA